MPRAKAARRPAAIDMHVRWCPPEFMALPGEVAAGTRLGPAVSADALLSEMRRRRVEACVVSQAHPLVYESSPETGLRLARAWNDACAALHAVRPDCFFGAVQLPMQSPQLAVRELRRAAGLPGMRALGLGTHVNGSNLDAEAFWPVYAGCETLGLPVLIQPMRERGSDRLARHALATLYGGPCEIGLAAASLTLGGVLDAFPGLRVVLPQGGGTFPWLAGRFDRGRSVMAELKHLRHKPSAYLRRFHYDTGTQHPGIMRWLIDLVGADRIVLGSGYGEETQSERPVAFIERIPGISARERQSILAGNARRLLRL